MAETKNYCEDLPFSEKAQLLPLVGLAKKAGKLSAGTPIVAEDIAKKKAVITVLSLHSADNAKKKITDKCIFYNSKIITTDATPEELARACGGSGAYAAVAIKDSGLAKLILSRTKSADGAESAEKR